MGVVVVMVVKWWWLSSQTRTSNRSHDLGRTAAMTFSTRRPFTVTAFPLSNLERSKTALPKSMLELRRVETPNLFELSRVFELRRVFELAKTVLCSSAAAWGSTAWSSTASSSTASSSTASSSTQPSSPASSSLGSSWQHEAKRSRAQENLCTSTRRVEHVGGRSVALRSKYKHGSWREAGEGVRGGGGECPRRSR